MKIQKIKDIWEIKPEEDIEKLIAKKHFPFNELKLNVYNMTTAEKDKYCELVILEETKKLNRCVWSH